MRVEPSRLVRFPCDCAFKIGAVCKEGRTSSPKWTPCYTWIAIDKLNSKTIIKSFEYIKDNSEPYP